MGLCQALLGNFDSAVVHYERALALDPSNAWYHHNLGHLLDVALNLPQIALSHLRWAHDAHPMEDEVTASLAHCLARSGSSTKPRCWRVRRSTYRRDHDSHASLVAWIRRGAPGGYLFSADQAFHGRDPRSLHRDDEEAVERNERSDRDVLRALERGLQPGGAPTCC